MSPDDLASPPLMGAFHPLAMGVERDGIADHALVAAHLLAHPWSQDVFTMRHLSLLANVGGMERPRPRHLWAMRELGKRLAWIEREMGRTDDA